MKISILSTTTAPTPPHAYGGEVFIYDLAYELHLMGHEVILYAAKNNNIEYPFKLNQLKDTHFQLGYTEEFDALKFYKDDLLSSDVILDMTHLHDVSKYLYHHHIKREIACYMIGNCYLRPRPIFNVIVNSLNQLNAGIKGETGFEGTIWQGQSQSTGTIPITSKYAHLGVNTDFYKFNENKSDYFLWLARFHPHKGPMMAIQLAIETGINLIIAGDITTNVQHYSHGMECLKAIEGHDNIKYVQLPQDETHQQRKMELMSNAKCYLFPVQFHESFGLTTVEALSCGTPVIATNMGALPEIVKHGETGFIARNYEAMKTYINSIDEIKPKNCRKDVEERFSRRRMAERFEKILIDLKNGASW